MDGYGIYYYAYFDGFCAFDNSINKNKIEVWRKGFTGTATELINLGDEPVTIDYPTKDDFVFKSSVCGSELTLEVINDQITLDTFLSEDETFYLVKYYRDLSLFWQGFITPDLCEEKIYRGLSVLTFKAIDNLASLDDSDYAPSGDTQYNSVQMLSKAIIDVLAKTSLNNKLGALINLSRSDTTPTNPIFQQTFVSTFSLKPSETKSYTNYEAISGILSAFGAVLFQDEGKWKTARISDLATGNVSGFSFNADGTKDQALNLFDQQQAGANFAVLDGATVLRKRLYKKASLNFQYGTCGNLIIDSDFGSISNSPTAIANTNEFQPYIFTWNSSTEQLEAGWSTLPVTPIVFSGIYWQIVGTAFAVKVQRGSEVSVLLLRNSYGLSGTPPENVPNATVSDTDATYTAGYLRSETIYVPRGAKFEVKLKTGDRPEKTQFQVIAISVKNPYEKTYYMASDGEWILFDSSQVARPYEANDVFPNTEALANKELTVISKAIPDDCEVTVRFLPGMSRLKVDVTDVIPPDFWGGTPPIYAQPVLFGTEFRSINFRVIPDQNKESHTAISSNEAKTTPEIVEAIVGDNFNNTDIDEGYILSRKLPRQSFLLKDNTNFSFTQNWSESWIYGTKNKPLLYITIQNILNQYASNIRIIKGRLMGKDLKKSTLFTFKMSGISGSYFFPIGIKLYEKDCQAEVVLIEIPASNKLNDYEKYTLDADDNTISYLFVEGGTQLRAFSSGFNEGFL